MLDFSQAMDQDICMMFNDWASGKTGGPRTYMRRLTSTGFNPRTGKTGATYEEDYEIDAIVSAYDQDAIGRSNGNLLQGDIEVPAIRPDTELPDGELLLMQADPVKGDLFVWGTQVFRVNAGGASYDQSGRLWVMPCRLSGGGTQEYADQG